MRYVKSELPKSAIYLECMPLFTRGLVKSAGSLAAVARTCPCRSGGYGAPISELAFAREVACLATGLLGWKTQTINHQTAIFRQVNKDKSAAHNDALEFPDGRIVLLTRLCEGQAAIVLQLPAQPATAAETDAQKRVTYVG